MKTVKRIVELIDTINNKITSLTMWLIIPLIGIMLFEVVMRYAFHSPTVWGAELRHGGSPFIIGKL